MLNISTTPQSTSQVLKAGIRLWKQSFRQVAPFAGIFVIAYWSFELILHALKNQSQTHDKSIVFVAKVMFQVELIHSMEYAAIMMDGISFILLYPLFYSCILSLLYDLQARKLLKSTQSIQA